TGNYSGGIFTISGTPSVSGTFPYTVTTTGTCTQTSQTGTITVNPDATISNPANKTQTVCVNTAISSISYTIAGGGTGAGATGLPAGVTGSYSGGTFTISGTPIVAGIFLYTVTTTGTCSQTSQTGTITVKEAVQITTPPQNVGVCVTNPASLSVVGYGDDLTYQWYKGASPGTAVSNSANISGATSPTLNFNQANISDGGTYYVVVSGDASCSSVISNEVTLNVNQVMNFTSQPISQTLCEGSNATFSITATGAISSYQWRKNGVNISGANAASYTVNNITTANNGNYDIVLTGVGGTCPNAYSTVATLTATVLPTATISFAGTPFCNSIVTAQSVTLTGTNAYTGGTYSAPVGLSINSTTGAITPSTSTAGTYTVTYTIPASGGCGVVTATTTIVITAIPTANISYSGTPFCKTISTVQAVTLSGTNAYTGGTYSAPAGLSINLATGAITPSSSTAGTYTVTYTVPASGGCAATPATTNVTITALPVATFNYNAAAFCKSGTNPNPVYTGGGIAGTFSSTPAGLSINASTGAINLAASTAGTYSVTNTVPASGGCIAVSASTSITIYDVTVPGTLAGYALDQSGNIPNPIVYSKNLLACESTDGEIVLSGNTGAIIRWESSIDGGATIPWNIINNTTNSYPYSNIPVTTIYRAVIQSGNCSVAYSNIVTVSVVPQDIKPEPVTASDTTICWGKATTFTATSGYGTGQFLQGGGFNTGQFPDKTNDDKWRLDGIAVGNAWTASASNTKANNWAGTTDQPFGTYPIFYSSLDKKFAISNGDLLNTYYGGTRDNTTLETPRFNTYGLTTAVFKVDMAYNLELNDYAKIELSLNGGVTYNIVLFEKYGKTASGIYNPLQPYSFDLQDYVGQGDLRVKFTFKGTTVNSVWALDEITIPTPPVDENIVWTNGDNNIVSTTSTYSETPKSPGVHDYFVTSFINGCVYTATPANTVKLTINVSYAFAGNAISVANDDCGNNAVKLNAYDNTQSADYNLAKGAFDPANKYDPDDDPGTGATGKWTVAPDLGNTCGTGTFSTNNPTKYPDPTNDPDAIFTGNEGIYNLTWTAGGCSSVVQITLTDCTQINFDGVNDNITFNNNYNLTNSFSIEVWVKPEIDPSPSSTIKTIFSKRDVSTLTTGYDLRMVGNTVSFNYNGSTISSPYSISENRWYHIAVTFDGTYRLYIDGIEVVNSGGGKLAPTANNFDCILGAMDQTGSPPNKPVNYFSGWMDELRIYNVTLTPEQLHQMMNQKIISSPTVSGNVQGVTIPLDINGLLWTNLLGYYQMESVGCGYLNPTAGTVTGKLRNITSPQEQTAPIPYTTKGIGNWNDTSATTPWTYGNSVWDYPNSKGYNNIPIDWNIVRTSHNVISDTQDITLLGLLVDANKLTITGAGTQDENNSGHGLWITHYLKLNGIIDLVGESQLVQKRYGTYDGLGNFSTIQFSESIFDAASSGYLERDQQGQKNSFNYNYWSSPVSPQNATANNAPYSVGSILKDGTNSSAFPHVPITFGDGAYFADVASSPIKISNRWIWSYNALVNGDPWDDYYRWNYIGSTGQIKAGEGFTMKGTGGSAGVTAMQNYVFVGKPHSGDITNLSIAPNGNYLIGNPYPSALDANEFILDNLAGRRGGVNIFSGTLYFWDHFRLSNNHILAQYAGGYAAYTLIGGVVAIADTPLTVNDQVSGSKKPERYIPIGQAFFVEGTDPDGAGPIIVNGGTLVFQNNQRFFKREVVTGLANSGSVFLKSNAKIKVKDKEIGAVTDARIRLAFDSPKGYHRQLLAGVDTNTTNQFDIGYDAPLIEDNNEDMFWLFGEKKYMIQGVNNFNENQELPLGLKISKTGLATIKIEEVQNIDENTTLHIKDKFTGKTHNISYKPFEIELEPGTYLDRFALIFKYQKLVAEDLGTDILIVEPVVEDHNYHVFMNNTIAELQIKNNGTDEIRSIALYNNLGQTMITWNKDLNRRIISLPVKLATGVYMVQINTINGSINKRIIIE
ncbi:MAG: LamG-like jellyroll fold domain-containing protein, partial [Lutibacter sp.]|nr:LamG-like jellyroll fold domain-containing protein [Lutibacter sp.]